MLARYCLLHSYDIPSTTPAMDLVRQVVEDMKSSRMRYTFVEHYTPNILVHEALPLLLMIFRDRGRALASDGEIKLRRIPMDPTFTLQSMFEARTRYTPTAAGNGIEDGRFIIHLSMCSSFSVSICWLTEPVLVVREHPLTAIASLDTNPPRVHTCISKRVYDQFPGDLYPSNQAADIDTSCTESQSESEDSDMEDILPTTGQRDIVNVSAHYPTLKSNTTLMHDTQATSSRAHSHAASHPLRRGPSTTHDHTPPPSQGGHSVPHPSIPPIPPISRPPQRLQQPPQALIRTASIPDILWVRRWAAPVFSESEIIPLADLRLTAFMEATAGSVVEKLEVHGSDVRELARSFLNMLGEAAKRGDFTSVLSPERAFNV